MSWSALIYSCPGFALSYASDNEHELVLLMTEQSPVVISLRYTLTLAEAQNGFYLATTSQKWKSRAVVPLVCVLIVLWGLWLGVQHDGLYFVILGSFFLLMQAGLQYVLLPWLFKRQYLQQHVAKVGQGIDVSQQEVRLFHGSQSQAFPLLEVEKMSRGKLCYVLTFKSGMVSIVPRRVVDEAGVTALFESALLR